MFSRRELRERDRRENPPVEVAERAASHSDAVERSEVAAGLVRAAELARVARTRALEAQAAQSARAAEVAAAESAAAASARASEARAAEMRAAGLERAAELARAAEHARVADARATEKLVHEARVAELTRAAELAHAAETRAAEARAAETRAAEARAAETRAVETRAAESRVAEARAAEALAIESRAAEARAAEARAAEKRAAEAPAAGTRAVETRATEGRAAANRAAKARAAETRAAALTAAAEAAAERIVPDFDSFFLTEPDRPVATPRVSPRVESRVAPRVAVPAAEAATSALDVLMADLHTTTTEIPLPTPEQLRSAEEVAAASARRGEGRRGAPSSAAPAGAWVPRPTRTLTARPAPRAQPSSERIRTLARNGVTVAAMAFVALMAVSTSVPAEALLSSADVQAAALAAQRPTNTQQAQSLDLASGTDTIAVQRDGYQSRTIAEEAAASGIRMEASFTNDPNGTIQWPFPVGVHIGSRFGHRDCAGCSVNHQGQDFNPGVGAPIQAIADGVVSFAADGEGSLGVHMMIDHVIDGKVVTSVYAHMIHGSMLFKVGDVIQVGQVIGKVGTTGMSTGPHLHFEIRLGGITGLHVDPLVWLYANTN